MDDEVGTQNIFVTLSMWRWRDRCVTPQVLSHQQFMLSYCTLYTKFKNSKKKKIRELFFLKNYKIFVFILPASHLPLQYDYSYSIVSYSYLLYSALFPPAAPNSGRSDRPGPHFLFCSTWPHILPIIPSDHPQSICGLPFPPHVSSPTSFAHPPRSPSAVIMKLYSDLGKVAKSKRTHPPILPNPPDS